MEKRSTARQKSWIIIVNAFDFGILSRNAEIPFSECRDVLLVIMSEFFYSVVFSPGWRWAIRIKKKLIDVRFSFILQTPFLISWHKAQWSRHAIVRLLVHAKKPGFPSSHSAYFYKFSVCDLQPVNPTPTSHPPSVLVPFRCWCRSKLMKASTLLANVNRFTFR